MKNSSERSFGTADVLALAIVLGLGVGLTEAVVWGVQRYAFGQITSLNPHVVWMAPLVYASLLVVLALMIETARRFLRGRLPVGASVFVVAVPPIMALLLLGPRLHEAAVLLLAAGVAFQLQRFVRSAPAAWSKLTRRGAAAFTMVVLAAAAAVVGSDILRERRALASLPDAREQVPDVLFIILDTVRAASLSLYGYARNTSPELDRLARNGAVFELAVATAPWTLPSHASMFTGLYPHELDADWRIPLGTEPLTLAEALATRGYATAGFVANTGYTSRETGLARGFHHYAGYKVSVGEILRNAELTRWIAGSFRLRRLLGTDEHLNRQPAPVVSGRFLNWLDALPADRPFFAFLNYYDAHQPYLPPPSHATRFGPGRAHGRISPLHRSNLDPAVRHRSLTKAELQEEVDAYDASLAFLDEQLGQLFRELERRGRLDRTLVIVTADHGEEFGEHGVFDHGNSLYLASVHVPLIVRLPGVVPSGLRVEEPVSLRDLPATVLSLVDPAGSPVFPGRSLASVWDTSVAATAMASPMLSEVSHAPGHPDWFPVSRGDMQAILTDGVRYIRNGDGVEELYDIDRDPWERTDLADQERWSAALARSRSLLSRWIQGGETRDGGPIP